MNVPLDASGMRKGHALDEALRDAVATKGDVATARTDLKADLTEAKFEILKWVIGLALAQMGLLAGLLFKTLGH